MRFPTCVLYSVKRKKGSKSRPKKEATHCIPLHPMCTSRPFPSRCRTCSLTNSCLHSTVTERSWGARHRLGTQGAETRSLICWHHHLVQKLEDTNSGEKNKFNYLARTIICSPSVEQDGGRCDRNQRGKSIYYQAHGKSCRVRIGRITWDSKVWLSLLLVCRVELRWRLSTFLHQMNHGMPVMYQEPGAVR